MKNQTKILLILISLSAFFTSSCIFFYDCTNVLSTTKMNVFTVDSLDTFKYNDHSLLSISFDIEESNPRTCSDVHWKNKIKTFTIVSSNDYNENYKEGDILNDIVDEKHLEYAGFDWEGPNNVSKYLNKNSGCQLHFIFTLTVPPDSIRLHKFTINYEENDDSTKYSFETVPFYITP